MSHYIEKVTVSLENLISELARNPSLFLKNPDTDFSRNRKINFKTCVGITMNSGGCTLNKELLDFFDFDVNAPTVSAYTQQRAKILPEAFEYLFHAFGRYEKYPVKDCALLMTAADNFFWTFEQAMSYYKFALVNYIWFHDKGMVFVGGCGDTNGKAQIEKTEYLEKGYEFGKSLYVKE